MAFLKKKTDQDVEDVVAENVRQFHFDFYATAGVALAVGLEAAVSGGAGHHVRAAFVYAIAAYTAILALGFYIFRTFTKRYDAFRTAYVVLHLPTFVSVIVFFVWGMIEQIIKS